MSDLIIIYIAAALVVGLLVAFVFLAVKMLAQRVSGGIRTKATELLSTYDELLEKKSVELKKLESETDAKQQELDRIKSEIKEQQDLSKGDAESITQDPQYILDLAEKMGNAEYQDGRIGSVYQRIRSGFNQDPLDVLRELVPDVGDKGPATLLLEQLTPDVVFGLGALSIGEQMEVLDGTLDEPGRKLLSEFMADGRPFKAIAFYDFLKQKAMTEPQPVVLRVNPNAKLGWLPSSVVIMPDEDICEGFELEANNQLFDYCVRKSEISK